MRITRAEKIAIAVTFVLVVFAVGYFLGQLSGEHDVRVESVSPEPSETVEALLASIPDMAVENSVDETENSSVVSVPMISSEITGTSGLLNLNSATILELQTLPCIGEVLAQRIVDYREVSGGFTAVEELKNVDGIGDVKFEAIVNLVEVVIEQ